MKRQKRRVDQHRSGNTARVDGSKIERDQPAEAMADDWTLHRCTGRRRRAAACQRKTARPHAACRAPTGVYSVGSTIVSDQDFATTLHDGRRVIGRREGSEWSIYVYSPGGQSRLLAYGIAATRADALQRAGLTGEDAGEVLGRIGI